MDHLKVFYQSASVFLVYDFYTIKNPERYHHIFAWFKTLIFLHLSCQTVEKECECTSRYSGKWQVKETVEKKVAQKKCLVELIF